MPIDVDNVQGEFVLDPYKSKERWHSWDKKIPGISAENEAIIVKYLENMRSGINVAPNATKGRRGYIRLFTLRTRLKRICTLLAEHEGIVRIDVSSANEFSRLENAVSSVFEKMEEGKIHKIGGGRYLSVIDYVKVFKAFWHWYMTYLKREKEFTAPDITQYLTVRYKSKPSFVYFGEQGKTPVEEGFRKLLDHAKYRYKAAMYFMFDSGTRNPTELMNIKGKDIVRIEGTPYLECQIREETTKTFGRRIKLMLCHDVVRRHIKENNIGPEDFVFGISPPVFNRYLNRLGERVLGKSGLTMYDFRHCSACYFVSRYKNQNSLIYRFGWKDPKEIHYYTEFIGMRDTLNEEDLLVDTSKTDIERHLDIERKLRLEQKDELAELKSKFNSVNAFMDKMTKDPIILEAMARKVRADKIACEIQI